jgi:aminopeptidase N
MKTGFRFLICAALTASANAASPPPIELGRDYHSYANVNQFRIEHLSLELQVVFEQQRLSGVVDLDVKRQAAGADTLTLDTRDLTVRAIWWLRAPNDLVPLRWEWGDEDATLGRALRVAIPGDSGERLKVRVSYQTRPGASGLQWVPAAQTAGKTAPFLFTQSQAIHSRSWIPLQDTPQVRFTYDAKIFAPPGMRAVMSAENSLELASDGVYRFKMPQAIPSYLMALGVGKLEFAPIGPRTGVFAEGPVLAAAANEFADVERMLEVSERLFGPYRWGRYDLLILPPSFPFGGMENPRLSFITPTVIAGDRSLVSLIAHELAHSWSGNLVTNATWRDLWLNEGFTVFLERRIVQALYGERRHAMEDVLGLQEARDDLATLPASDQALAMDLRGRDPDDVFSQLPYEKGRLFLGWLESRVGRDAFDDFLRRYFDAHAFRSITTEEFRAFLERDLLAQHPGKVSSRDLDEWMFAPGLPRTAVLPTSDAFTTVDAERREWLAGRRKVADLSANSWTTHEWLHFLDNFPRRASRAKLAELDAAFALTASTNAEVAHSWLRIAIRNDYAPAYARLDEYLTTIGRRKLIRPLYEDLMRTAAGQARARDIFARARAGYHPIAAATIERIVYPPRRGAPRS